MKHRRHARKHHRRARFAVRHSIVRMNPITMGGILSKETLAIASGAVAASIGSNLLISRLSMLPFVNTALGRAGYNLLIPVAGAFVARRWVPNVAKGLIIGGLANALGQVVVSTGILPASSVPSTPAVSLPAGSPATTGEYLGEYLGGSDYADAVGAAFATNAWA